LVQPTPLSPSPPPPCLLPRFISRPAATPETYTLSLHDALPISRRSRPAVEEKEACRLHGSKDISDDARVRRRFRAHMVVDTAHVDRKSTRLNSSHVKISYAVFCLKKKNTLLRTCRVHTSTVLMH